MEHTRVPKTHTTIENNDSGKKILQTLQFCHVLGIKNELFVFLSEFNRLGFFSVCLFLNMEGGCWRFEFGI